MLGTSLSTDFHQYPGEYSNISTPWQKDGHHKLVAVLVVLCNILRNQAIQMNVGICVVDTKFLGFCQCSKFEIVNFKLL